MRFLFFPIRPVHRHPVQPRGQVVFQFSWRKDGLLDLNLIPRYDVGKSLHGFGEKFNHRLLGKSEVCLGRGNADKGAEFVRDFEPFECTPHFTQVRTQMLLDRNRQQDIPI